MIPMALPNVISFLKKPLFVSFSKNKTYCGFAVFFSNYNTQRHQFEYNRH